MATKKKRKRGPGASSVTNTSGETDTPPIESAARPKGLAGVLHFLTITQWRAIDRMHRTGEPFDGRPRAVLVVTTLVLIALQYVGKSDVVRSVASLQSFYESLPEPDLGPKLYWAWFRVLVYTLVPLITLRVLYRGRLRDYGLRLDRNPKVLLLYAGLFLVVLPLVWLVSDNDAFLRKYPLYANAGHSLAVLATWEASYALQFFGLELFFRGFLIFALARSIGAGAIFVMVVPYTMIHFTKPMPETLGAVITGIALGTLALRTRSIWGGVLVHTAVGWSMDLFALYRKGVLGALFGA